MDLSVVFGLVVVFGAALGLGVQRLLGDRVNLNWSEAVLSGIVGAEVGALFVTFVRGGYAREFGPALLLWSVVSTVAVMLVVAYFTRRDSVAAPQLIAGGESAHVEFKSTARCNLHTGQRDDKIELVIAKTVAAMANSGGGHLLIGVDDEGRALGLAEDLKFMKSPDLDRYELWMRDFLTKTLGSTAAASVTAEFPQIDGQHICHLRISAAPRPVFLTPGKGQPVQMWVRVGNSTRQLGVDESLSYAADHWGRRRLR
jgi:hypothetical protein